MSVAHRRKKSFYETTGNGWAWEATQALHFHAILRMLNLENPGGENVDLFYHRLRRGKMRLVLQAYRQAQHVPSRRLERQVMAA
jgi:hypothetical protein